MKYTAHINHKTGAEQTVDEHNRNTGELSGRFATDMGMPSVGRCAGLVHDIGKLKAEFNDYVHHGGKRRGEVNHTFAGVIYILNRWHQSDDGAAVVLSELIAYAAGSHHGLFDCVGPDGVNGFRHRLEKQGIGYDEVMRHVDHDGIGRLFDQALVEFRPVYGAIAALAKERGCDDMAFIAGEFRFYMGLLARMLLSSVVDGDRRDTASFMSGTEYPDWQSDELFAMWSDRLDFMESKLSDLDQSTEMSKARRAISDACRAAAEQDPGLFVLHVETGGGKTLSGMRFALAHAARHRMRHVIFTAPRLTILDQNADVIREYLGDDSLVLEHHSNVAGQSEKHGMTYEELCTLIEGWECPVVVTTAVQFLNNLFFGDMKCVRRMHSMCRSVILIDEVQAIPDNQLSLFCLAVNFLTRICHSTIVLCSATQPDLLAVKHSVLFGEGRVREIPIPRHLFGDVFKRVRYIYEKDPMGLAEIANLAVRSMEKSGSTLVVCNKKRQASELYSRLSCENADVYHLSASMCANHRRRVFRHMSASLAAGRRVICVSTQVIEAGVDVSFGSAIRFMAGLEAIVQTAGRVHRHGGSGLGDVYIVSCKGEDLRLLRDIRAGQDAMYALLAEFDACPDRFGGRLDSKEAVEFYYRTLYGRSGNRHDYLLPDQAVSMYELLSWNRGFCPFGSEAEKDLLPNQAMRQAFKSAGEAYSVFGESSVDVIMPYGRGKELIVELGSARAMSDLAYAKRLIREASDYTVSIFRYQLEQLEKEGALVQLAGGALGLVGHYDDNLGFVSGDGRMPALTDI